MLRSTYTKSRYRVVNRRKFFLSTAILVVLAAVVLYYTTMGVQIVYAATAKHFDEVTKDRMGSVEAPPIVPVTPVPTFEFTAGTTQITAYEKDEYIDKLQTTLVENTKELSTIQEKYTATVNQEKKVTKETTRLYREYGYVLDHPSSDVNINDIKMVENLCKEYGGVVNPHLWFSLVELESSYNSNSKNSKSTAKGWGQVLTGTGRWIYEDKLKLGTYNHARMGTNKEINARISIYYLTTLINDYGIEKGLINYNGGELGVKYANIVVSKLKKNANLTLKQVASPTRKADVI